MHCITSIARVNNKTPLVLISSDPHLCHLYNSCRFFRQILRNRNNNQLYIFQTRPSQCYQACKALQSSISTTEISPNWVEVATYLTPHRNTPKLLISIYNQGTLNHESLSLATFRGSLLKTLSSTIL